ncbi:DUF4406 domain-containing protein [Ruminiclostridium herbifermentans]|uniref:DUF4406 domain-containing protein n=1 Tax=Ruminiclostridium herbifermentans TaxID=2488810 RepID=A0A7H1VNG9_9FIRM|nr:DUF4406 domain-containing protein [Ruminiclostridium herbifermentans]QNU66931.1 DUF4406 domain-containing protein [Ruminiclostridium herbifermentans]
MFNKKLVYVCSPVKGDIEENITRAKEYCKTVLIMGYIPIAPHVTFNGILNDKVQQERETALALGLELVKHCDEVWVFGNVISEGMQGEIELAKQIGIPVKTVLHTGGTEEAEQNNN